MSKSLASWCVRVWLGVTLAAGMVAAQAAGDPPGRVGRLAELDGSGWMQQGGQGEWAGLQRNQPVTTGDWISTDPGSRARVEIGSTVLRLDGGTVLQVRRLDDARIDLWLQSGAVSARIRQPEVIREFSLGWAQGSLQPTGTGAYVLRLDDEGARLSVLAGEGRFNSPARSFNLRAGQSVQMVQQPGSRQLDITWTDLPQDRFVGWVQDEDLRSDWARDNPPVSSEMTGADDLDRYGRWEQHPDYGVVWQPMVVNAGWAPYRYGRWLWVAPWGWTWVDDAPWGFAPFHYGRWVYWGTRWVWVYLLLEFQSKPDKWMAVRMMTYVSLLAQSLIKQKQLQQGRLPALIPLVLYNGQARWTAPTDVNQCFAPSLPGLARFRPRLMYHLIDEARLQLSPSAEVRNLVDAVFQLERSTDFDTVGRAIMALRHALQAPGQNELQRTLNAWLREQLSRKAPSELSVATTLAHLPDLMEGTPMLADTMGRLFTEALQKGKKQGRKEGRQEGRDEGVAWTLTQLFEHRFGLIPEWALARIQSAKADQLVSWARLSVTAPNLEALFVPAAASH